MKQENFMIICYVNYMGLGLLSVVIFFKKGALLGHGLSKNNFTPLILTCGKNGPSHEYVEKNLVTIEYILTTLWAF